MYAKRRFLIGSHFDFQPLNWENYVKFLFSAYLNEVVLNARKNSKSCSMRRSS